MKKISYKKLWKLLIDKNSNKQTLSQVEKDIKYVKKQNYKDFVLEGENNTGSEYNAY